MGLASSGSRCSVTWGKARSCKEDRRKETDVGQVANRVHPRGHLDPGCLFSFHANRCCLGTLPKKNEFLFKKNQTTFSILFFTYVSYWNMRVHYTTQHATLYLKVFIHCLCSHLSSSSPLSCVVCSPKPSQVFSPLFYFRNWTHTHIWGRSAYYYWFEDLEAQPPPSYLLECSLTHQLLRKTICFISLHAKKALIFFIFFASLNHLQTWYFN